MKGRLLKPSHLKGLASLLKYPFKQFARITASGGHLLLTALCLALAWANSPWQDAYHHLWEIEAGLHLGPFELSKSLHHWINDGLMALFFFLVGLEIKRELLVGELSVPRKAAIPVAAAVGGMVVPALLYYLFNAGLVTNSGWAIPMATDIAFTLGILSLLGERAPLSLKIFLTALAIVDDIGAILVIGLFYSAPPDIAALSLAALVLFCMVLLNRFEVHHIGLYSLLSLLLWMAFLASGIHATLAGVLAAFTIPAKARLTRDAIAKKSLQLTKKLQLTPAEERENLADPAFQSALLRLSGFFGGAASPLVRLEERLHPWVSYGILPLFAFANSGVTITDGMLGNLMSPLTLGILAGLCLGKPLGIAGICWLLDKLGWAEKPDNLTWLQLSAGGCFAGIGFTMSIFIAGLAFPQNELLEQGKAAILLASFISTLLGILLLTFAAPARRLSGNESK